MNNLPHVKRPCRNCPFRRSSLKGWLGIELELSGRELVFDSLQACIEHHKFEPTGE